MFIIKTMIKSDEWQGNKNGYEYSKVYGID